MSILLTLARTSFFLCVCYTLYGCTQSTRPPIDTEHTSDATIVWPQKPEQARIVYIKSFTNAETIGIKKGFFTRLLDFFTGETESQLVKPMAILPLSDDIIYVTDPGARGVHRFDLLKGEHDLIQAANGSPLLSPVGIAMGKQGEVYVTDSSSGKVLLIRPGKNVADPVNLSPEPRQPTGITIDQVNNRLYVVDTAEHNVKVYTHTGELIKTFGQHGNLDGEFNYPTMIWQDKNGRLLITDALNFRIQIFDSEGNFIRKFGHTGDASGDMSRPKGVATDSSGNIYVVDSLFHNIQLFNPAGDFLLNVGSQGQATGEFWLPTGIFISDENKIYVADSHNKRVQVFRYIGDRQ